MRRRLLPFSLFAAALAASFVLNLSSDWRNAPSWIKLIAITAIHTPYSLMLAYRWGWNAAWEHVNPIKADYAHVLATLNEEMARAEALRVRAQALVKEPQIRRELSKWSEMGLRPESIEAARHN